MRLRLTDTDNRMIGAVLPAAGMGKGGSGVGADGKGCTCVGVSDEYVNTSKREDERRRAKSENYGSTKEEYRRPGEERGLV